MSPTNIADVFDVGYKFRRHLSESVNRQLCMQLCM